MHDRPARGPRGSLGRRRPESQRITVAALCDVDSNLFGGAVEMITKAGKPEPKCVQDPRHVLDDQSIDAVSIATPNHWHSLAAIWAMRFQVPWRSNRAARASFNAAGMPSCGEK